MSDYDMDQEETDLDLSFAAEQVLPEGTHEYRVLRVKQVSIDKDGRTRRPVVVDIEIKVENDETGEEMVFHESAWFDLQNPKMGHKNAQSLAQALGGEVEGNQITGITPLSKHVNQMGTVEVKKRGKYTNFDNMTPYGD